MQVAEGAVGEGSSWLEVAGSGSTTIPHSSQQLCTQQGGEVKTEGFYPLPHGIMGNQQGSCPGLWVAVGASLAWVELSRVCGCGSQGLGIPELQWSDRVPGLG